MYRAVESIRSVFAPCTFSGYRSHPNLISSAIRAWPSCSALCPVPAHFEDACRFRLIAIGTVEGFCQNSLFVVVER